MEIKELKLGDTVTGLLIDGSAGTPYAAATLKVDRERGVFVEVPYIEHPDEEQFRHINEWFTTRNPPENLILQTPDGDIGLFGIRWIGHRSTTHQALGRIKPHEVLIGGYDGNLSEPLVIEKARSRIDGLMEWTSLRSLDFGHEADDQGLMQELVVTARTRSSDSWKQGEATLHFASEWRTELPDTPGHQGINIDENVVLVSSFPEPRPFTDHLDEHRKIADFLTLVFGLPIRFREHKVSSPGRSNESTRGVFYGKAHVNLISSDTFEGYGKPLPKSQDYNWSLLDFEQLGTQGLETWSANYEAWRKKFINPAAALFRRTRPYAEDVVNTLSMTLEAAGNLIGVQPNEECTYIRRGQSSSPGAVTQIYRCLEALGVDWGDIGPHYEGIARGINKTYNATKHFNEGEYPQPEVLIFVSILLRYIVRLLALRLADARGDLLDRYKEKDQLLRLKSDHKHYGVSFDHSGTTISIGTTE